MSATTSSQIKQFGLWRTTSLVVGNMVGTSIFLLPAVLAPHGSISLLGWIFTAIGAMLLALVFARLSRRFPKTGGPYAYSRLAFGDFVGFQMAWSYWIANWVSNAAVAIAFVNFLSYFVPELASNSLYAFMMSVSTLWGLTLVNAWSLKSVGTLQIVTTVLKLLPLALIGIFGLFYIDLKNFTPLLTEGTSPYAAISGAAAITLFSFMGLESATVPAQYVKDPHKTIPRATILGTVLVAILYIWTTIVVFGILSPKGVAGACSPFSDAGFVIFGGWSGEIIAASAALSCFGTLNGWILLQGQVPLAAARDGLFPAPFLKVSSKGIPVFGLIFSSILITILLAMNFEAGLVEQFSFIVTLTTFAVLLPYLYSAAADLFLMFKDPEQISNAQRWRAAVITLLAIGYSLWAIMGAGAEIVYLGTFFVLSSVPVYVWMKVSHMKTKN